MYWYWQVLKKYAVFKGRARRKEFWMFKLMSILLIYGILMVGYLFHASRSLFSLFNMLIGFYGLAIFIPSIARNTHYLFPLTYMRFYGLAIFIPSIAVAVRRLHDIGKSGWLLLWVFCIEIFLLFATICLLLYYGFHSGAVYPNIPLDQIHESAFDYALFFLSITTFIMFIVVAIYMLILYCRAGQKGINKYGENPKEII
ncbi:MAG: DUF805 domain-containing protein [Phycisphaerales bacterium]|nr:DUF805 domain-containing protein [Phycisphaerales bacterium]